MGSADGKEDSKIINLFYGARTSLKNKFTLTSTPSNAKKSSIFNFLEKKERPEAAAETANNQPIDEEVSR